MNKERNIHSLTTPLMNKLIVFLLLIPGLLFGQAAKNYAVLLTAQVEKSPPSITIKWDNASSMSYLIHRKLKSENNFTKVLATLSGSDSMFVDTTVNVGESYEYRVRKQGSTYWGYGYISAGIEVPPLDIKGKLILLIDAPLTTTLSNEIDLFIKDLDGEGWAVQREDVPSSTNVAGVKNIIATSYNADPANTKAVLILGHVAVPYSGNLAPDGHPDHVGAWPADLYYGEMNGTWGDNVINTTSASDSRNHNIPGDGKFDNTSFPSPVELQVGRIDLSDMPAFSSSETELLRRYLQKNHAYRTGQIKAVYRAVIDDNFGGFSGEAFAASAWKSFGPIVGIDSIIAGDYFNTTRDNSYIWSYGCGGGSFTSAGGIGNTNNFASDSLQSIFTALFGSYFGDWDRQNSFLRAPLAQGLTLTNAWSGRPHWHFHHMALGENIGYSMLLAANNGPYEHNYANGYVHIGFMGDPTLRLNVIEPPSNLQLTEVNNKVDLTWSASPDNVLGYHIYRKQAFSDLYERMSTDIVIGTSYTDNPGQVGQFYYSVRAIRLEEAFSGSYYNLSTGAGSSITTLFTGLDDVSRSIDVRLYPNPNQGIFTLDVNVDKAEEVTIYLTTIDGRTLSENHSVLENGKNQIEFSLPGIQPGMYLIRLYTANENLTRKVIIE
jgi:hypothetical protein